MVWVTLDAALVPRAAHQLYHTSGPERLEGINQPAVWPEGEPGGLRREKQGHADKEVNKVRLMRSTMS